MRPALELSRTYEHSLLEVSGDARNVAAGLRSYCESDYEFPFESWDFLLTDPLWLSRPGVEDSKTGLLNRHGRAAQVPKAPDEPWSFLGNTRQRMIEGCEWIEKEDERSRMHAQALTALASGRAQADATRANIRLQWIVLGLSMIVVVVSLIQLYVSREK